MPFVGIWSPTPKEAPFVCIEPWCGIADAVDATGQLAEKFGINKLPANELFKTQYMIKIKKKAVNIICSQPFSLFLHVSQKKDDFLFHF